MNPLPRPAVGGSKVSVRPLCEVPNHVKLLSRLQRFRALWPTAASHGFRLPAVAPVGLLIGRIGSSWQEGLPGRAFLLACFQDRGNRAMTELPMNRISVSG